MPQHAVSAGQPHIDRGEAGDQEKTVPALHNDAYTFSPPLAGNDVSGEIDEPSQPAPAPVVAAVDEAPRDGSNDNIPADRALVVVGDDTAIAVVGEPVHRRFSRPVAMAAAASLLLLGTVAFLYAGFPPQTKVEPPRTQLAAIPSPAAPAAAEVSGPAAERNISSLLRAPEAAAAPIAAATPTVEPTPAAERAAAPPVTQSPSAEASPPLTAAPSAVAATEGPAAVPDPVAPVTDAAINPVSPPAVEASRALIPSPAPPPGSTRNTASAPAGEGSRLAALPGPQTAPSSGPPRPPVGLPTPAAQGPARGQFVFVQRPDVNIRNRPSQAGQIVGMAQIGGRFVVAGREGEWVMVGQGPWRGWIHQRFLAPRLPR